jgi:hypothetical protein
VHPEGELVHIGSVEVTFFRFVMPPLSSSPPLLIISCRFVHDRVQEAFYSMMDPDERRQTHLKIARLKKERYKHESQGKFFYFFFVLFYFTHRGAIVLLVRRTDFHALLFISPLLTPLLPCFALTSGPPPTHVYKISAKH